MSYSLIAYAENHSVTGHQSTVTVPIPTGLTAGQTIVVFVYDSSTTTQSWGGPDASWSAPRTGYHYIYPMDHIITATDVSNGGTGNWVFTNASGANGYVGYSYEVWGGLNTSGAFDNSGYITSNSKSLTFTPTTSGDLVIAAFISNSASLPTFTQPSGFTETPDAPSPSWNSGYYADEAYSSTYAGPSMTWTTSASNGIAFVALAYKAASGGTVYNENLGIAGSATFSDSAAVSFNTTIGIAGAAGFSDTQSAIINAAAVFAGLSAIGFSSGAQTYNENLGVAGSAALILPANISANTLLNMAGNANISAAAHAVFNEVAAIAGAAGLQVSSTAIMAVSMALAGAAALGMSSAGAFVASLCRYYYIMLESRTLVIPPESRTYYIGSENRTETIPC